MKTVGTALAWMLFCTFQLSRAHGAAPDATERLEDLGIPYGKVYRGAERIFARNPWDLHAFAGHLYLAAGNSSNTGPAQNAGPVPILRFDPATDKVEKVFRIDDEQIDLYYTFGDRLYLPGHDPKESWELGNVYRLEADGAWKKHRNVPDAIHIYAMALHDGKLFAGTGMVEKVKGRKQGRSAACISADEGATWTQHKLGQRRIHAFLHADGTLYAVDVLMDKKTRENWKKWLKKDVVSVFAYDSAAGQFTPREDIHLETLLPGHARLGWHFGSGKPVKPLAFAGGTVYIGGAIANDHQYLPVALFIADSLKRGAIQVRRAALPKTAMPWDLLEHDGQLYVLTASAPAGPTTNVIYVSDDGKVWKEFLRFKTSTFARSFAFLDGALYVALGCRVANPQLWGQPELHPDTGRLLRIPLETSGTDKTGGPAQ